MSPDFRLVMLHTPSLCTCYGPFCSDKKYHLAKNYQKHVFRYYFVPTRLLYKKHERKKILLKIRKRKKKKKKKTAR